MKNILPLMKLLPAWIMLQVCFTTINASVSAGSIAFLQATLTAPYFRGIQLPPDENFISFSFTNGNENSETEIYRSLSPDSGYGLVQVVPAGVNYHYDETRKPRTTYYFKLRAIRNGEASDFSFVRFFTTGSKFYDPLLEAKAGATSIELVLTDMSYHDTAYEIWRVQSPEDILLTTIYASDSGQVFTFTDRGLSPNTGYFYKIDAHNKNPNFNKIYFYVATAYVQTTGPRITGFTLVDPDTDKDLAELSNKAVIPEAGRPNIRANTTDVTGSVVFYLNGIKRTENVAPYAYFFDSAGDYKPGSLTEGEYMLEAIAFSGNNGQGTQGNTLKIQFSVRKDFLVVYGFTLVDPATDEDIGELRAGDVVDASLKPNIRANTDAGSASVVFYLNGLKRTENESPYSFFHDANGDYKPGTLKPGHYILEATAYNQNNGQGSKGNPRKIEFTVTENGAQNTAATLSIYPNPVVHESVLEVFGEPGGMVRMNAIDPNGYNQSTFLYEGSLNDFGYLKKDLQLRALPKGTYVLMVTINEQLITQRFQVK
jgi:hypothetical protein